jgi:hypothetical protein
VGQPFPVFHLHAAQRSFMAALSDQGSTVKMTVARDKIVFNKRAVTANIWMAKLEGQK